MDAKDVREARRWLEINGWLDRRERPGFTPMFKVRLEQRETRSHRPTVKGTPGGNAPRAKCPKAPLGEMPHPPPGANAPPINNPLTRTIDQGVLEPPLPPTARGERRPEAVAAHPCRDQDGFLVSDPGPQPAVAVQPQPQQRPQPKPLPEPAPDPEAVPPVKPQAQKREAGFKPAQEDVPAALLPVVRELLAFWPARKGAKTLEAWKVLCRELQRIQDHPQGGTEIVRGQLEAGTTAGIDGKAWQSIRFANWLQYGTKAGTPVMGKRSTMDRVMGAIALVEDRERKATAAQQAGQGALPLAEVA